MLSIGTKLSPDGSWNRETALMLSLGRPSKPDDKALGRDSGGALFRNVVAFTSLFQPQSTSSEDGCEPLHRDGQCGLKVISWCSLTELKAQPRPWSKRTAAFMCMQVPAARSEGCFWWLVCPRKWGVQGKSGAFQHARTRVRTHTHSRSAFVVTHMAS